MSRVGKNSITVPPGVNVIYNNNIIEVQGKLGKDSYSLPEQIIYENINNIITVKPKTDEKTGCRLWGTAQRRIANMIFAVDQGASVRLELSGVGYRASVQGSNLVLQLGYSHEIIYPVPMGIIVKCDKPTNILITGPSKQKVGQMAAEIRSYRPPEPYKGKGVIRAGLKEGEIGEIVVRKEGKKK